MLSPRSLRNIDNFNSFYQVTFLSNRTLFDCKYIIYFSNHLSYLFDSKLQFPFLYQIIFDKVRHIYNTLKLSSHFIYSYSNNFVNNIAFFILFRHAEILRWHFCRALPKIRLNKKNNTFTNNLISSLTKYRKTPQ